MNALIIGRYQPVTIAHVGVLREMDDFDIEGKRLDKIIVGIGTLKDDIRNKSNPFTFEEVKQMWLPILATLETPVEIYQIPDLGNPPKYAEHVEWITGCNEKDTILVSRNESTMHCFSRNSGYGKSYSIYLPSLQIKFKDTFLCATIVRDAIAQGEDWRGFVLPSTAHIIDACNGVDRIKQLYLK